MLGGEESAHLAPPATSHRQSCQGARGSLYMSRTCSAQLWTWFEVSLCQPLPSPLPLPLLLSCWAWEWGGRFTPPSGCGSQRLTSSSSPDLRVGSKEGRGLSLGIGCQRTVLVAMWFT